ncbi:MAG: DUF4062 domain-containing protein [Planctomycetaceae bacterium]|nr:DUF4062 domain-containing protein [Planctomycetaceae bacterium]
MKIFVSSTVYDLIDIRSEVAELLRSLGLSPILSDDSHSDFSPKHDANSIESCLANIAASDAVILILDQRYGPSLKNAGFEDKSATHLEYERAIELGKPIHVFVRDRLEADFSIWKKNDKQSDLKLTWVEQEEFRLFELLSEHRKLIEGKSNSNWVDFFSSSIDLKKSIQKKFETMMRPQQLADAIAHNEFPLFDVQSRTEDTSRADQIKELTCKCTITNVGGASAFNVQIYWKNITDEIKPIDVIVPTQSTIMCNLLVLEIHKMIDEAILVIEYDSMLGVRVIDQYRVYGELLTSTSWGHLTGVERISREFSIVDSPTITISE